MSYQDREQELIWDFLNSRPRVTYAEVAQACPGSDWKRQNYLRRLRHNGTLKFCAREGKKQYFTIFDVTEANALAAELSNDQLDKEWAAQRLATKLREMGGKTTAQVDAPYEPQEKDEKAVWEFIRQVARFSAADVSKACGLSDNKRNAILRQFENAKMIRKWGNEGRTAYFTALSPKELQERAKEHRGTKHGDMWTAIRIRKVFFAEDILASLASGASGITLKDVKEYCKTLHSAGYLQEVRQSKSGINKVRYRLVKNTGPLPPVKKRVLVVIDGNEDKIVHASGGRLA